MDRIYKNYIIRHFRDGYVVLMNGNEFYFDSYKEAVEFIDEVEE